MNDERKLVQIPFDSERSRCGNAAAAAAEDPRGIHLYPAASAAGDSLMAAFRHRGPSRHVALVHVSAPPGSSPYPMWVGTGSGKT